MEASAGIPAQLATCWLLELGAAATLSELRPIREMKILLVLVCVVKDFRRHGWLKDLLGLGHRGNITIHKVLGELLQMFPFILDECERRYIIFDIEGVIIAGSLRNGTCQVSAGQDLHWPVLVLPQQIR